MSIVLDGTTGITTPAETVSGNLGIGTGSPAVKLDISGTTQNLLKFTTTNTEANINFNISGSTGNFFGVTGGANFFWYTGSSERMRLDSSGNLGLGVTPSAWSTSAGRTALQIGGSTAGYLIGNNGLLSGANFYYNSAGNNIYINSAAATLYQQYNGAHSWFIAPSGTAGTAITFTQAMTLDASGNLGLGATSINAFGAGYTTQQIQGVSGGGIKFYGGSTNYGYLYGDANAFYIGNPTANLAITFQTNNANRMTLDSSGNLGIGTISPAATAILDVQSTTKGVRFPNMTTAQKTAITPSAGTVVFDTTLAKLCVYSGSAWQTITSV